MEAHVPTARDPAAGRAKKAVVALLVASIGLLFVADLYAPPDVPLGAAVIVPVLISCFLLDQRWALVVLGLAIVTRVADATVGDTPPELAVLEVATYLAAVAITLSFARRVALIPQRNDAGLGFQRSALDLSAASLEAAGLTDRERQVLEMAIHGLTAKQIGERLYIGRRTVETHVARAYGKLGARTKSELIAQLFDDPQRTAVSLSSDSSS
jgi:DNA-binding CsgD family transcriptional regulator